MYFVRGFWTASRAEGCLSPVRGILRHNLFAALIPYHVWFVSAVFWRRRIVRQPGIWRRCRAASEAQVHIRCLICTGSSSTICGACTVLAFWNYLYCCSFVNLNVCAVDERGAIPGPLWDRTRHFSSFKR